MNTRPFSLEKTRQRVIRAAETRSEIYVSESMEILGYGRTKGVLVFEYLDNIGLTVRQGDYRVLNPEPSESETPYPACLSANI